MLGRLRSGGCRRGSRCGGEVQSRREMEYCQEIQVIELDQDIEIEIQHIDYVGIKLTTGMER